MRVVIVGEDRTTNDQLLEFIHQTTGFEMYRTFSNPILALTSLSREDQIDLLIIQVDMTIINGFELAKNLSGLFRYSIFTSHLDSHGPAAFEAQANNYLVTPICFSKFVNAIQTITRLHKAQALSERSRSMTYIKGSTKNSYIPVALNNIKFIEALRNYVKIHLISLDGSGQTMLITYLGLSEVEKCLETHAFIRISRSIVISIGAIKEISGNTITMQGGVPLMVSPNYRKPFFDYVRGNLMLLA